MRPTVMLIASTIGVVLIAGGVFALLWRDEIPRWRAGGAGVIKRVPLAPLGTFPIKLMPGKSIVFVGDSNTAGSRVGGRENAYPSLLTAPRRAGTAVVNRAVGGAIAPPFGQTGNAFAHAQLVVVMLGTNDAAPRRCLGQRSPVPLALFRERLTSVVRDAARNGAQVLVMAAPPVGSPAMDERIAPYRTAAREVAVSSGVRFQDPMAALATDEESSRPMLSYDGLHLNAAGQARLASWLDQLLWVDKSQMTLDCTAVTEPILAHHEERGGSYACP